MSADIDVNLRAICEAWLLDLTQYAEHRDAFVSTYRARHAVAGDLWDDAA